MFRVTVRLFSGRPDPTWIVTDQAVTYALLARLRDQPEAWAARPAGFSGLGFRGVEIEFFGDDQRADTPVPSAVARRTGRPTPTCAPPPRSCGRCIEAMPEHCAGSGCPSTSSPRSMPTVTTALRLMDGFVETCPR